MTRIPNIQSRAIWLSEVEKGQGYAVDFLAITLHAVSRDPEAYPSPCIYTQIDTEDGSGEEAGESDLEASGDLQLAKIPEMRIILSDPGQLDALFDVFCHCAELNPDPNAGHNEDNSWFGGDNLAFGGGWIHGDEDMIDGNDLEADMFHTNLIDQNGLHDLNCSVRELEIDDQRFEDAEEEHEIQENGH
uniref:Chloride conductance regulatory protein ICln n=1 Tax=Oryza brachyantha TaxID=4533 RepID=J3LM06_ORYBR